MSAKRATKRASGSGNQYKGFVVGTVPQVNLAIATFAKESADRLWKSTRPKVGDFVTQLKEEFDKEFGLEWHCVIGTDFSVDIRFRKGYCVVMNDAKAGVKVLLFKSAPAQFGTLPKQVIPEVHTKEDTLTPKVVFSDMGPGRMAEVLKLVRSVSSRASCDEQAAQLLKNQLTALSGPLWHVVASESDLKCKVVYEGGNFMNVKCGKFRFVMWKHSQEKDDDRQRLTANWTQGFAVSCYVVALLAFLGYHYHKTNCPTRCKPTQKTEDTSSIPVFVPPSDCSPAQVSSAITCDQQIFYIWIFMISALVAASVVKTVDRLRQKLNGKKRE